MKSENTNCSIHDACERIVPFWLVSLLDNIPNGCPVSYWSVLAGLVWVAAGHIYDDIQ